MKVIELSPRGYCHGVVTAMQIVSKTLSDPNIKKPVYILGDIVHNKKISDAYEKLGATTIRGENRSIILDKVDSGTVIITAHGISPVLIKKAEEKGLNVINATCSDVKVTHELIKDYLKKDYEVVYIGKKNHPEPEGAIGINPTKIHLVSEIDDVKSLNIKTDKIILTNQTTLSMWSLKEIIDEVITKFPSTYVIKEICDATKLRQEAVFKDAKDADLTIVVGDPKSNNTAKLVEISENIANVKAIRIDSLKELDVKILLDENVNIVAITAGASTPSLITKDVINFIKNFDKEDEKTHHIDYEINLKRLVPRIRK